MSADRDITRVVRSWLRTDEHESASRVLDNVLAALDTTPQRRSWWPARRSSTDMNPYAKFAIAAAAIVVVAVVGLNMVNGNGVSTGGVGPTPTPSSTATPTPSSTATPTPTPLPTPTPPPTAPPRVLPSAGALAVGRHQVTTNGTPFSVELTTPDWNSGDYGFDKGGSVGPSDAWLLFWNDPPIGVFDVPCAGIKSPAAATLADLADAIASIPGTDLVSGPEDVTVGGYPAKHVVVTVREDIGCPPDQFYLWYGVGGGGNARYASQAGSTIRVWAIDVDGKIVWIDGETYLGAPGKLGKEIQKIIDSVQFE
jgi:hypothetical protein